MLEDGSALTLGEALWDGVGVGSGSPEICVGVGTGGMLRIGGGEEVGTMAGGAVAATVTVLVITVLLTTTTGAGPSPVWCPAYPVVALVRAGATPSPSLPPTPPFSEAAEVPTMGVPSAQPTTTANGSPIATTPIKTDLGDKRTSGPSPRSGKSYGFTPQAPVKVR